MNAERVKVGAAPLQINETLRKIVRYKSNEIKDWINSPGHKANILYKL